MILKLSRLPALAVILIVLATCCRRHDGLPARADAYLEAAHRYDGFHGSVLIASADRIVYERQIGYANMDTRQPIDAETVFELASVSKQFTAAGILLLAERNLLRLDDSLQKFFPELPYPGVTVHHLLTHTSGLPDYEPLVDEKWDRTRIAFNDDVIRLLATEKPPALFVPGSEWRYSNTGYLLLASVIGLASGEPFAAFLKKNIFDVLGMARTRVYNTRRSGEVIDNYAYGYVFSDSLQRFVLPDSVAEFRHVYYMDGIQGDGVVNSTARDLLKWHLGLSNGKVLTEASLAKAYTPVVLNSGKTADYGYGWSLRTDSARGSIAEHGGNWPGYGTHIRRFLDHDKVVIVLSNTEKYIHEAIGNIVFDQPVELPRALAWADTPTDLSAWEGQFVNLSGPPSDTISFFSKNGQLMSRRRSRELAWRFATDGRFYNETRSRIGFGKDGDGADNPYYIVTGGVKRGLRKL
jgi:CubicO group peptidase (beta-lactamase class C family)